MQYFKAILLQLKIFKKMSQVFPWDIIKQENQVREMCMIFFSFIFISWRLIIIL